MASAGSGGMDRAEVVSRRERIARALDLKDEILLVGAGEPVGIPGGMDQTYPFLSHAEYFYLADRECIGGVIAFDPKDGAKDGWRDFEPDVTEKERVWEGPREMVGESLSGLAGWLAARRGRQVVNLGSAIAGVRQDAVRAEAVREQFTHARRPKSAVEIERIRAAVRASEAGYKVLQQYLKPGVSERRMKIELEAEFFRNGADRTCYGSIVGVGSNAAVFHFTPGEKAANAGDLVLVDAGAERGRYGCDITRTYCVGTWEGVKRDLYLAVLNAEKRACEACRAGVEYRDVHLGAALDMTRSLVEMGLMKGDPDSLVEQGAHLLFFPHGVGHFVGLGVRDASGRLPGRPVHADKRVSTLRCDLPLMPGYVLTIEPGLYIIPALLDDPARREKHKNHVAWERVEKLYGMGGVRIEDNILVTEGEPVNLTAGVVKEI
ncbi:MAG: M24 family metallopeptidase [Phycisphaeraceae bacterium]|nr:M24 family metallopeptidase [Phycisphaeraceae bacterium]